MCDSGGRLSPRHDAIVLQCCRGPVLVEVVIPVSLVEVVIPVSLVEVVAVNTRNGRPLGKSTSLVNVKSAQWGALVWTSMET